nr:saccharopine dehydrogenase NADP-binding domain-containing protein [Candidatus Sigynarchaeota archaeon]
MVKTEGKAVVLGGCGVVGTAATKTLANAKVKEFSQVVIADIDLEKATQLAKKLGDKVSAIKVNAGDAASVKNAVKGATTVLNCVGPYYTYEKTILPAVIESGINYVDVNDDTGATYEALAMDGAAKKANITAIIGMGSSPGVTNMLAGYAAKGLMDECESIDLFHTHGGEPTEGPGVIAHRFYCMNVDVPMFLDGKAVKLSQAESEKHTEMVEFINLPGKHKVYPYPHPEPITLPMFLKDRGLKRVTNKGNVLPVEYYDLTRDIHKLGLSSKEPVVVNGVKVIPHDFAIAYLIKRRDEILKAQSFGEQRGCVKIVCKGKKKGTLEPRTYVFSLVSEGAGKGQALGEATGLPCAFGAILLQRGKIKQKGVLPPEACVDAMTFMSLMSEALSLNEKDESKKSPVIFESIDEHGVVKRQEF